MEGKPTSRPSFGIARVRLPFGREAVCNDVGRTEVQNLRPQCSAVSSATEQLHLLPCSGERVCINPQQEVWPLAEEIVAGHRREIRKGIRCVDLKVTIKRNPVVNCLHMRLLKSRQYPGRITLPGPPQPSEARHVLASGGMGTRVHRQAASIQVRDLDFMDSSARDCPTSQTLSATPVVNRKIHCQTSGHSANVIDTCPAVRHGVSFLDERFRCALRYTRCDHSTWHLGR